MIFSIHYALIMAGYASCGLLLGRYMMLYGGANEFDLGFVFMIHPLSMFLRPIVCAQADRFQIHKKLLCLCVFLNSMSYVPFAVIPFLLQYDSLAHILTPRVCFWILVVAHTFGSLCFCGVRSLGDSLAVNYAKRVNSDFASYRKYGSISFGSFNYLLGFINQNWLLPDFTPVILTNVVCLAILSVLIYHWSDDYFIMMTSDRSVTASSRSTMSFKGRNNNIINSNSSNIIANIESCVESPGCATKEASAKSLGCGGGSNAFRVAHLSPRSDNKTKQTIPSTEATVTEVEAADDRDHIIANRSHEQSSHHDQQLQRRYQSQLRPSGKRVSSSQQLRIFLILVRRDFRIPLFLLLLFYGGLVGYAPPNYVFTYMDMVCTQNGTCDGAFLSGLTMIVYCAAETLFYLLIKATNDRISHSVKLNITLASLAIHYYFYGFILPHVSPYFFLVETLHGLEYSISISSSVELGHKFANEIELVMPELIQRGIVKQGDDPEMVKKSLLATMSSCFTLVYEGLGTIVGVFIYGLVIDAYSFTAAWILIGTLSSIGFLTVLVVIIVGRCLNIKPQVIRNYGQLYPGVQYS